MRDSRPAEVDPIAESGGEGGDYAKCDAMRLANTVLSSFGSQIF